MLDLYIKDGCPHCRGQIEQLEKEGLSYRLHNVSHDHDALKKVKELYNANKVPVLVKGETVQSIGYLGKG